MCWSSLHVIVSHHAHWSIKFLMAKRIEDIYPQYLAKYFPKSGCALNVCTPKTSIVNPDPHCWCREEVTKPGPRVGVSSSMRDQRAFLQPRTLRPPTLTLPAGQKGALPEPGHTGTGISTSSLLSSEK